MDNRKFYERRTVQGLMLAVVGALISVFALALGLSEETGAAIMVVGLGWAGYGVQRRIPPVGAILLAGLFGLLLLGPMTASAADFRLGLTERTYVQAEFHLLGLDAGLEAGVGIDEAHVAAGGQAGLITGVGGGARGNIDPFGLLCIIPRILSVETALDSICAGRLAARNARGLAP